MVKPFFCLAIILTPVCVAQSSLVKDPSLSGQNLPPYLTLIPKPSPEPWSPITPKQRFEYYVANTYSPMAAFGAASGAAISQWMNSPKEWGQGWESYGKRVLSSYGGTVAGNTINYGTSALFHEDNRFYQSQRTGSKSRILYVIASPFIARNRQGEMMFSKSAFLGGVGSASIPLLWSPRSWQGWDSVGINFLTWYAPQAGQNLGREFYRTWVSHYRQWKNRPLPAAPADPPKK
jgi:hypothetical protein